MEVSAIFILKKPSEQIAYHVKESNFFSQFSQKQAAAQVDLK